MFWHKLKSKDLCRRLPFLVSPKATVSSSHGLVNTTTSDYPYQKKWVEGSVGKRRENGILDDSKTQPRRAQSERSERRPAVQTVIASRPCWLCFAPTIPSRTNDNFRQNYPRNRRDDIYMMTRNNNHVRGVAAAFFLLAAVLLMVVAAPTLAAPASSSRLSLSPEPLVPKTSQVRKARAALASLILSDPGNFIPGFVRLAFHDTFGTAGMDGCLDSNMKVHRGLQPRVDALAVLYSQGKGYGMSLADFWALSSVVALELSLPEAAAAGKIIGGVPGLKMRFGRIDTTDCKESVSDEFMPDALGNGTSIFGIFATKFGLSAEEVVALMGIHSLGRTNAADQGFTFGPWVANAGPKPHVLSNTYYSNMDSSAGWVSNDPSDPAQSARNYQWTNPNSASGFLNADMSILKSFPVESDGRPGCSTIGVDGGCPDAPTAKLVRYFAQPSNNDAFISKIGPVLTKVSRFVEDTTWL